ncbi:hypothetical protein CAP35_08115 [Chitinophagaceae bacterium IBVUCB1]|nr:hypothetical protein CAP35_08115 [Chitinophagaceae bacterium IBVUCB1]
MLAIPAVSDAHYSYCTSTKCYCGGGGYAVPLDGGLSLMAIAGAGYGISRVRASRKKKNTEK